MSRHRHWSTPAFETELRTWVEGLLGPVGLEQVKLRPWSTVWRARTAAGEVFYAKQNCPANDFEAALAAHLAGRTPEHVGLVTAVDAERGLLLTPDQGDVLSLEHADLDSWCRLVQRWAVVQRQASDVDALGALGVPLVPVAGLASFARERIELLHDLDVADPRRLDDTGYGVARAALPVVRQAAEEVAAVGLPSALNHNDLHGHNVFRDSERVFDLGDAAVSDPAGVLLVPLGMLVDLFGCGRDDPRLWRVADAWVEVWSDLAPVAELRRSLPSSMRLARVVRHDAWWRVTLGLDDPEVLAGFAPAGAEYLGALPDPPLLSVEEVSERTPPRF